MIFYSKLGGYKYRLEKPHCFQLPEQFRPAEPITLTYFSVAPDGNVFVRIGYCFDGPSGPTIDTPDFMRPSLEHDLTYQLLRLGYFDYRTHRKAADIQLYRNCRANDMPVWRANYVYLAVRWFAEKCAKPKNGDEEITIYEAP